MQFNVPLLPVELELRCRPIRRNHLSIRSVMLVIGVVGVFFAVVVRHGRLNQALNFHSEQLRSGPQNPAYHRAEYLANNQALLANEIVLALLFFGIVGTATLYLVGLAMNWWHERRSG